MNAIVSTYCGYAKYYEVEILTRNVHAFQEHISKDVSVGIATTLDATECVSVTCAAKAEVDGIKSVIVLADGEGDVGNICIGWVFPAAVALVVDRTIYGG